PAALPDPKLLARLIADLDDDRYRVRRQAARELANLGELAKPALRRAFAGPLSLETRRSVDRLLAEVPPLTAEQVRILRMLEVLEKAATPEALELLRTLAKGAREARLTVEAEAALRRMSSGMPSAKPK